MYYYEVSPLRITHSKESLLTYASTRPLQSGQIVAVEVGKKMTEAVVREAVVKPGFSTKEVSSIIEETPLPAALLSLHDWLTDYYKTHSATVWRTMLPSGLAKKRRVIKGEKLIATREQISFSLNSAQQTAVDTVMSSSGTQLLYGVTGSGKTAVYIELAKQTIAVGKSVILLVPEIALTSQLVAEFTPHFENIHVTHSTMTEAARHSLWQQILHAKGPQVIIGPRSALFMPVQDLGLIVIDEAHEPALKQESAPRYSALRAASMLGRYTNAKVVLGSATPAITDYYLAKRNGAIIHLPERARQGVIKPEITLVDMTKRPNFTRSTFISNALIDQLTQTLNSGHQALIFHNRRGSAPITLCENCGWNATCPRCYIPLTLHADDYMLRCHLCNHLERVPTSCPDCHVADIIHKGIGTKRIEEELRRLFPNARVARFDGDTKSGIETEYQSLYDGDIDIIIGTQVVAKGLDLPKLRMVGVIQADSGLALPDYGSSERVFQLLSQVSGRVGRNEHKTHVIIQSYQPSHPSVALGIKQNYPAFYDWEIAERKRANFPPFTFLLKLTAVYKTEAGAIRAAKQLVGHLQKNVSSSITIFGPAPAFHERLRDTYRWQIVLKSSSRSDLLNTLQFLPPQGWQSELDPISLL